MMNAEALAYATASLRSLAMKFNPAQPRDDHGRWTDAGSTRDRREMPAPSHYITAYKIFDLKGGKLYPTQTIDPDMPDKPTPVGVWLRAEQLVGKKGPLAPRLGWHGSELPISPQQRLATGKMNPTRVWAKIRLAADPKVTADLKAEAALSHRFEILNKIPGPGFYEHFESNKFGRQKWLISGGVYVERILQDDEVATILRKAGRHADAIAEQRGSRAELKTFDPDQPRDDHGRWTETGAEGDVLDVDGNPLVDMDGNPPATNPDGTLTLYHRTSPEVADAIRRTGRFQSLESTQEAYFSNVLHGQAEGFGEGVVTVHIKPNKVRINDAFHGGEIHVAIPIRRILPGEIIKDTKTFDPDQPRDDHGRWTSGGDASGTITLRTTKGEGSKKFLADIEENTQPNPFDDRVRVYENVGMFDISHSVEDPEHAVHLGDIRSFGEGGGSKVMKFLTSTADKHGVDIELIAKAYEDNARLNTRALRDWYGRLGFEDQGGDDYDGYFMVRRARKEGHKYNPDQPRAPEGSSIGGRWIGASDATGTVVNLNDKSIKLTDKERAISNLPLFEDDAPTFEHNSRRVGEIASELNDRAHTAIKAYGIRGGVIKEGNPEHDEMISRLMAAEVQASLGRSGVKVSRDWYSKKVDEAIGVIASEHPEVLTDPNARSAFALCMAIPSQGETVRGNTRIADEAYWFFKKNGRFPTDMKVKDSDGINGNFTKLNALIKANGGGQKGFEITREFLSRKFKAGELAKMGYVSASEFKVDAEVYGSAILGAKVGQGFYQNVIGNYEPVTFDRWFMRAWNRLTGDLHTAPPETMVEQRLRLEIALKGARMKVPKTTRGLDPVARKIVLEHEQDYRVNRALYDSHKREKREVVYAAERYLNGREGIRQEPRGPGQRAWITARVNRSVEILKEKGMTMSPADFQAAWWYPEKHLYDRLGGRDSDGINIDYATAFRDYYAKKRKPHARAA